MNPEGRLNLALTLGSYCMKSILQSRTLPTGAEHSQLSPVGCDARAQLDRALSALSLHEALSSQLGTSSQWDPSSPIQLRGLPQQGFCPHGGCSTSCRELEVIFPPRKVQLYKNPS